MQIELLGGLRVTRDGLAVPVSGAMQLAVLFRLAVDASSAVSYRAIAEDVWGLDAPENARAALQSIVSRLRSQLPAGTIESTAGGYRLAVARSDVDALVFGDLVAAACAASDPGEAARFASDALALWTGAPWIPSENFDWFERDLLSDRSRALQLGGVSSAPEAPGSSIPAPLTSFVGRETELAMVHDQLGLNRLVTIVGTGGAGKTRLATEAARGTAGSILVELAPVEPAEVWQTVLAATGREIRMADAQADARGARERAIEALAGRDILLVLDNCEHLVDAAATAAGDLLTTLPKLRVLATSREPLGLPGEAFVNLSSLEHPTQVQLDVGLPMPELVAFPAVELLRQRAVAARGRDLDSAELSIAAHICLRLDGLPLAIELAAAKLRTMTFDEVLAGLEDRFRLLTGRARAVLPRHQTLRAMVDWSWSLLSESERTVLARLAVFPAGIDAKEAQLFARSMGLATADELDNLVDKSLLQRVRGRFRALETIREYGIERLAEAGALFETRLAQASYMAELAIRQDALLRGPEIYSAIFWFDAEEDNLAAALRFSMQDDLAELAVGLVAACAWYWLIRDRNQDAQTWLLQVSPLAASVDSDLARVMAQIGPVAAILAGRGPSDGPEVFDEVLAQVGPLVEFEARVGDNELLQVIAALLRSLVASRKEDGWPNSMRLLRGEDLGLDEWPCAVLYTARSALAQNRGDFAELGDCSEQAVRLFASIGDRWGLALSQQMRAEWLMLAGRLTEALELTDASTENMRSVTSPNDLMQQQQLAVRIFLRLGDHTSAWARAAILIAEAEAAGNPFALAQAYLCNLGIAAQEGALSEALRYLGLFDSVEVELSRDFPQVIAIGELARASVDLLRGDEIAAERALHSAVDAAIASQDHPILAEVALGLGKLCLTRGDISAAARALELATALRGVDDDFDPAVIAIRAAMSRAGIDGSGTAVPDQPIPALRQLLSR